MDISIASTRTETPTRADVARASQALRGRVARTPVVRSPELDRLAGVPLWLKAENLQRGGSFKLRGATLAVERLAATGSRGVVAQSTGNHAVAVALAAADHHLPAILVLPRDVGRTKVTQIRRAGAEIRWGGSSPAERRAVVEDMRLSRGYDLVDSFESPDVVAGQATATAELIDQVHQAGGRLGTVVVPVGGGSAVAGACLAADGHDVSIIAAEPAAVPALSAALRAGHPVTVPANATIADGLRPDTIGELPFRLCQETVSTVETTSEAAIAQATCLALLKGRLLVEPAAATALAVAIRLTLDGQRPAGDVGVLLTGGNIEAGLIAELLGGYTDPDRHAEDPEDCRA